MLLSNLMWSKAYDRVNLKFLARVLTHMGFDSIVVDMVWRIVANSWYFILINGQAQGFFHFTRVVPLSPALFILTTKVLNKALNQLFYCNEFKCFGMPKWSENLNQLASANDAITFSSVDKKFSI